MTTKNKKRAVISALLALTVVLTGAFAFMAARTGKLNNVFKLGSSGAVLIENFNGTVYEGKADENDDGFANAVMEPGNTYVKTAQVKFTGTNEAYAYVKIDVPNKTCANLVDANGRRIPGTSKVVNLVLNDEAITTNPDEAGKWYLIKQTENSDSTTYLFGYTTRLKGNETTPTSPIKEVSVANVYVNNIELSNEKVTSDDTTGEEQTQRVTTVEGEILDKEYLVPVTAYTVQPGAASDTLIDIWNQTQYN